MHNLIELTGIDARFPSEKIDEKLARYRRCFDQFDRRVIDTVCRGCDAFTVDMNKVFYNKNRCKLMRAAPARKKGHKRVL